MNDNDIDFWLDTLATFFLLLAIFCLAIFIGEHLNHTYN